MAHIVRLDKEKQGNTHGWQVRGRGKRGYKSKLFSDGVYGGKDEALAAAETFLESVKDDQEWRPSSLQPPQPPPLPLYFHKLSKNNKSGVNGVHRVVARNAKGKRPGYAYWAAGYTVPGRRGVGAQKHKTFAVETYGEEEAKQMAIEFRRMWEEAVDKGEEAVKDFLDAYTEGWL